MLDNVAVSPVDYTILDAPLYDVKVYTETARRVAHALRETARVALQLLMAGVANRYGVPVWAPEMPEALWKAVQAKAGMLTDEEKTDLATLAAAADGWFAVRSAGTGPEFVALKDWAFDYDAWLNELEPEDPSAE